MSISTGPQAMVRKQRPQVLADIRQLTQAGDFGHLHAYLTQLAKWADWPQQYESLFASYLTSPEAGLREAAVVCLLVTLKIQKPAYRAAALTLATDDTQDFDVRMWAGSGLAVTYRNTKDPELLAAFLAVVDDEDADKYLKSSFIRGIVLLMGVSSREQWLRAQSDSVAALQAEFAAELATARILARGR